MASVTESAATRRCRWCGREFQITPGPGRPKLFCKAACRQADYLARQRSAEAGISEAELIVTREALEERSEEHTSELQSLMRSSYAVFCLKKKKAKAKRIRKK